MHISKTTGYTRDSVTDLCDLVSFILCVSGGLMPTSSGFIQCFYFILQILYRSFGSLDVVVDLRICVQVYALVRAVPVHFSVTDVQLSLMELHCVCKF